MTRTIGERPDQWAVVGGGMMGLVIALRLAEAGHRVALFEASPILGGLAAPWTLDDPEVGPVQWDRHYHVTLLSDSYTRGVLRDLDVEDSMQWVETKTGFHAGDKLVSMSNALEYLALPSMSPIDKVRLAATIVYGSRVNDWRALEVTPVEDWLTKLSGRSAFEQLWKPLLEAKLGDAWRESSAAFIWATIQRLYAARKSGLKKEMFGYVPGGYGKVVERFEQKLASVGVTVHKGTPVREVRSVANGQSRLRVKTDDGALIADRVLFTTTPRVVARLCPELEDQERHAFEQIAYQGVVCSSLVLDRNLANYYLTYLTERGLPFTAVVEMTAFIDRHEVGGRHLVYLPRYCPADHELFRASDEEVQERFLGALERLYPDFDRSGVKAFRTSRVAEVFPLPVLGYSKKLPPLTTSVPGLLAVSSAHIVNGTLNVNDTVRVAERAARSLAFSNGRFIVLD